MPCLVCVAEEAVADVPCQNDRRNIARLHLHLFCLIERTCSGLKRDADAVANTGK